MADYFKDQFLPNIRQATITYKGWRTRYAAEATKWDAYLAQVEGHQPGAPRPAAPVLTSRFGKALVAAAELQVSVTDIGAVYPPPGDPPPDQPTITTNITDGQSLTMPFTWTASADQPVDAVRFYADGNLVSQDSSSPFSVDLNLAPGTHELGVCVVQNGVQFCKPPRVGGFGFAQVTVGGSASTYTYRFATFDTTTDKITGTLNRFNYPTNAYWWVPGSPEPPNLPGASLWAQGGGIFPIATPYGPGLRLVCDPDMNYQGESPQTTRVCRFVMDPADTSRFPTGVPYIGQTHTWEWTWMWPSAGNLSGWAQALIEGFVTGNTFEGVASVGHHLYLQATAGGGLTYYMGRQVGIGNYSPTASGITFAPDTYHHLKFELRYSRGSDGFLRAYTDTGSGYVQWANFSGATVPPGSWSVYAHMFDIRPPRGSWTNTLHWINHRLTIS